MTSSLAAAQLSVTNLQRRNPSDGLRLLDLSQAWIQADLGASTAINLIAPLYVSATNTATWRVRAADTEADLTATPSYDSGVLSLAGASGLTHRESRVHGQLYLATAQTARYWRVDFYDTSNAAGCLDIGALVIDNAFQPTQNISYGWSIGLVDPSTKARSVSGHVSVVYRKKYLSGQLSLECQDKAAIWSLFTLDQKVGKTEPVLVIRDPEEDEEYRQQQTIYGILSELSPIVNDHYQLYSKRYDIEELIT